MATHPEYIPKLWQMVQDHPDWDNATFAQELGIETKQVYQFIYCHRPECQKLLDYRRKAKADKEKSKEEEERYMSERQEIASLERQLMQTKDALNAAAIREKQIKSEYAEMCEKHMAAAEKCKCLEEKLANIDVNADIIALENECSMLRAENEKLIAEKTAEPNARLDELKLIERRYKALIQHFGEKYICDVLEL